MRKLRMSPGRLAQRRLLCARRSSRTTSRAPLRSSRTQFDRLDRSNSSQSVGFTQQLHSCAPMISSRLCRCWSPETVSTCSRRRAFGTVLPFVPGVGVWRSGDVVPPALYEPITGPSGSLARCRPDLIREKRRRGSARPRCSISFDRGSFPGGESMIPTPRRSSACRIGLGGDQCERALSWFFLSFFG